MGFLFHLLALIAMPFVIFERLTPRYRWHFRLALIILVLLILAILAASGIAVGYPENLRHGYRSCAACHISGGRGGGVLNAYGRSAGAEIMPTWSTPTEADPIHAPDWLSYAADARYINANGSRHTKFWMQRELEIAIEPVAGLTIGGTVGNYGPHGTTEFRENYAKLAIGSHVTTTAGRYVPSYGIALADHRLPTRAELALGQGKESFNTEISVSHRRGEITLTAIDGTTTAIHGSAAHGYSTTPTGRRGWSARAALFAADGAQLGLSTLQASDLTAHGAHAIIGGDRWYLITEYDRRFPDATDLAIAHAGYEPIRGLHIGPSANWTFDQVELRLVPGIFTTWFPRPHLEFSAQLQRVLESYESTLQFHFFL